MELHFDGLEECSFVLKRTMNFAINLKNYSFTAFGREKAFYVYIHRSLIEGSAIEILLFGQCRRLLAYFFQSF